MNALHKTMVMGATFLASLGTSYDADAQGRHNSWTLRNSRLAERADKSFARQLVRDGSIDRKKKKVKGTDINFKSVTWSDDGNSYVISYQSDFQYYNYQNRGAVDFDRMYDDVDGDGKVSKDDTLVVEELFLKTQTRNGNIKAMYISRDAATPHKIDIATSVYRSDGVTPIPYDPNNMFWTQYIGSFTNNAADMGAQMVRFVSKASSNVIVTPYSKTGPAATMEQVEDGLRGKFGNNMRAQKPDDTKPQKKYNFSF